MGVVLLVCSACATFKATAATGKAGEKIGGHTEVMQTGPEVCNYLRAAQLAVHEKCQGIEKDADTWEKAGQMLAQYGAALRKIAEADDPDVADNVSSVLSKGADAEWLSLSEDQATDLGKAANAITKLVTQAYRQKVIKKTVDDADDHIQKVSTALVGHLDLQDEVTTNLQAALSQLLKENRARREGLVKLSALSAPDGAEPSVQAVVAAFRGDHPVMLKDDKADWMVYARVRGEMRERQRQLRKAKKAVVAFQKAHAKLKVNLGKASFEDAAAYQEILGEIKTAYEGFSSAADPEPEDAQ